MNRHLTLQQIAASVDDELSGVARELVERHLSSCPGCDAMMERVVRLDAELLAVLGDDPGPEFFGEMLVVIRGKAEALGAPVATDALPGRPAADKAATTNAPRPGTPASAGSHAPTPRPLAPRSHPPAAARDGHARAWIVALGVLIVPLVAFLVFARLHSGRVRDFGERFRATGFGASNGPASSASDPVAAVTLPPSEPPLADVESTAVVASPPAGTAPAPKAKPNRTGLEPAAVRWTPPATTETGLVCGEVRDAEGRPIAGAQVEVSDVWVAVVADDSGRFCMSAPAGDRTLTVRAPGFAARKSTLRVGPQTPQQLITLSALRR